MKKSIFLFSILTSLLVGSGSKAGSIEKAILFLENNLANDAKREFIQVITSNKSNDEQQLILVKTMLYENGLGLSDLPKGLVPFHAYKDFTATAFEEHLHSAAKYLSINGVTKLHFTVAEGDKEKFEKEFENIRGRVEEATHSKFEISYSYQDPKTDTIAVDDENKPFRDENDRMFFSCHSLHDFV